MHLGGTNVEMGEMHLFKQQEARGRCGVTAPAGFSEALQLAGGDAVLLGSGLELRQQGRVLRGDSISQETLEGQILCCFLNTTVADD